MSSERLFSFLCVHSGPLTVISFCVVPVYSPVPTVLAASNKLCRGTYLCRLKSLTKGNKSFQFLVPRPDPCGDPYKEQVSFHVEDIMFIMI